jgi:hypothetical protein
LISHRRTHILNTTDGIDIAKNAAVMATWYGCRECPSSLLRVTTSSAAARSEDDSSIARPWIRDDGVERSGWEGRGTASDLSGSELPSVVREEPDSPPRRVGRLHLLIDLRGHGLGRAKLIRPRGWARL